jgi:hypothetical protein
MKAAVSQRPMEGWGWKVVARLLAVNPHILRRWMPGAFLVPDEVVDCIERVLQARGGAGTTSGDRAQRPPRDAGPKPALAIDLATVEAEGEK